MTMKDRRDRGDLSGETSALRSFLMALPPAAVVALGAWWVGTQVGTSPELTFLRWVGAGTIIINSINVLAFFIAVLELFGREKIARWDREVFDKKLLPEDPETVIDRSFVRKIFDQLNALPSALRRTRLAQAVELCASKYQTSQSVSEVSESLTIQLDYEAGRAEGGYSLTKYLAWAIPSIGFIGTVMGLSQALGRFGGPADGAGPDAPAKAGVQDLMRNASQDLMLAFNTTFVALVLAVLLMYFYHRVVRREDSLLNRISNYCLRCFITKAYFPAPKG